MEKDDLEKASEKLIEYVEKTNPAKAAEMRATLDKRHAEREKRQKEFHGDLVKDYITKKVIFFILIVLFLAGCGVIIFLFTQSVFEGFIALLAFVFLMIYLVKK